MDQWETRTPNIQHRTFNFQRNQRLKAYLTAKNAKNTKKTLTTQKLKAEIEWIKGKCEHRTLNIERSTLNSEHSRKPDGRC